MSAITIFIAGITLELQYRELLWIFIGISLGVLENIRRNHIKREKKTNENYSYN